VNKSFPLISVVIPAYNAGRFVGEAIESVLNQTFQDFEIIVIDDGSTDDTHDVVSSFGEKIIYIQQENNGPAAARNAGIKRSNSKYIAFLDADDWWVKNKFEEELNILDSMPDLAFVCSDWFAGHDGTEVRKSALQEYEASKNNLADFGLLLSENFVNTSTVLVQRQRLVDAGLFNECLRGAEDRDLWLRLLVTRKAYVLDKPLAFRRFHQDNTSASLEYIKSQLTMTEDLMQWPLVQNNINWMRMIDKRRFEIMGSLAYKFSKMKKYNDAALIYRELYSEKKTPMSSLIRFIGYSTLSLLQRLA
jgi:glycosyltransferase involved in cell wall biosynthesis